MQLIAMFQNMIVNIDLHSSTIDFSGWFTFHPAHQVKTTKNVRCFLLQSISNMFKPEFLQGSTSTKPRTHPHIFIGLTSQLKSTSTLNRTRLKTVVNQPCLGRCSNHLFPFHPRCAAPTGTDSAIAEKMGS